MPGLRHHLSFVARENQAVAVAKNAAVLHIPRMNVILGISNGELLKVSDWEVRHSVYYVQ